MFSLFLLANFLALPIFDANFREYLFWQRPKKFTPENEQKSR